jgi:hypothetical protein
MTDIDRRILALLNEAGEENVAALVNSVCRCAGAAVELQIVQEALKSLLSKSAIQLATSRDARTLEWRIAPTKSAFEALSAMNSRLAWSSTRRLWEWVAAEPLSVVLLTPHGTQLSTRVLRDGGWRLNDPM